MDTLTANLSRGLGRRTFLVLVALLALGSQCWGQSLTINDVTATEGDSGTTPFTFTVTLTPSSGSTVTVNYATANASAFSPSDYAATSGTLTFDPGQITKTITVDVSGDTTWEGTEFFIVNLSAPTNATIADNQGLGGITNDDVQVSIGDASVAEGDSGTTPLTFNVTLGAPKNSLTVTVNWATLNSGAAAPADFTSASGTVTFLPGETAKTVTVDINGDTTWEGSEVFFVTLSSPVNCSLGDNSGTGTINNDDVQVSVGDAALAEGDSGTTEMTFNVTLGGPKNNLTVTVNWATQNSGAVAPADFTAVSGTVTFLPGETARTVSVNINGDTTWEGNEVFFVALSSPVNCSLGDSSGTGTINNDDVQVSVGDATLVEGDSGSAEMTFNVTLGGPKNNLTLSVNWATQNAGAMAPGDFTAAAGTVTFLPGEIAKTVSVSINGDTAWEANEAFTVILSNAVNCSLGDLSGTGIINNDDVQVSVGDASLAEGDSGATEMTFNVTLGGPKNNLTLSVNWATQNAGAMAPADFTAASGTVTFLPGETAKTVSVDINGDTTWEAHEAFNIILSNAVNCSLGDLSGTGIINNDDVQVSIGDATVSEGNSGTTPMTFDVTLGAPKNNLTLSVNWATQNAGAMAPADFTAASGTVTFLPGETAKTVTIDVNGDQALESNEAFTVILSSPVNCSLGDFSGTGIINNDDVQGVLQIDDLSKPEGQSGTTTFGFIVTLTAPSVSTVSVQFTTANDTAISPQDYTGGFGLVTFAPGETTKLAVVNVKGDTTDECTETFFINLVNPSGAPIDDAQALGTIEDDENPGCADLDADCSQSSACGGSDCDDSNPDTYAGAPEINDALDNQCPLDYGYGVADEVYGPHFYTVSDPTLLSWLMQEYATGYELVRASSTDFVTDCTVLGSTSDLTMSDPDVPEDGEFFFYLVRAVTPNVGSFGTTSSGIPRTVPCAP